MRRLFLLILCIIIVNMTTYAQPPNRFTCLDGNSHQAQFTVIPPDISDTVTDVTVTALGRGNFEPVIGITSSDDITDCYLASPEADYYSVSLPSGDIASSTTNSTGFVYGVGQNTIEIGAANGNQGAVVVAFEALIISDPHTYQFTLTEEMLTASEQPLNAYLVSLSDAYQPSLSISSEAGNSVDAEPIEIEWVSLLGEATSAVVVPLPDTAGAVEITVNPNEIGVYALIIEFQSGSVQLGDGLATVTQSEDGSLALACDERSIFDNGMHVTLPDDNDYTVTTLSADADPILALVDTNNTGICFDNTISTINYNVELGDINIPRDDLYPQATSATETNYAVFGGRDSASGSYVLIVEGGSVSAGDGGDIFEISVTPQMIASAQAVTVYVFTTDIALDPILTWELPTGELITCNDADIPDLCDQDLSGFQDTFITYGQNETLAGTNLNPKIEISLDSETELDTIRLIVSAEVGTEGDYILVLLLNTE